MEIYAEAYLKFSVNGRLIVLYNMRGNLAICKPDLGLGKQQFGFYLMLGTGFILLHVVGFY